MASLIQKIILSGVGFLKSLTRKLFKVAVAKIIFKACVTLFKRLWRQYIKFFLACITASTLWAMDPINISESATPPRKAFSIAACSSYTQEGGPRLQGVQNNQRWLMAPVTNVKTLQDGRPIRSVRYERVPVVHWDSDGHRHGISEDAKELILTGQCIQGGAPEALGHLRNLIVLDLARNALSGPIPRALYCMNRLESLELTDNMFYGPLPTSLAQLSHLKHISIALNPEITGTLSLHGGALDTVHVYATSLCGLEILHCHERPKNGPLILLEAPEPLGSVRAQAQPMFERISVAGPTKFQGCVRLNGSMFKTLKDVLSLPHLEGEMLEGRYAFVNPSHFLENECGMTQKTRIFMDRDNVHLTSYKGSTPQRLILGSLFPNKTITFQSSQ